MKPRILAFAGSARADSSNKRLIKIAAAGAARAGAAVELIDLADFPMPLFDQDLEVRERMPPAARRFKELLVAHDGFLIASPEGHRLRTALTMLGIIIGVSAIVAMVSIGLGARSEIEAKISRLGSNLLMVVPNTRTAEGVNTGTGGQHTLAKADAVAVGREVYGVVASAAAVTGRVRAVHRNKNWKTRLVGTDPEYLTIRDWTIDAGRNFSESEQVSSAKVAVIGRTVAERLSPGQAMLAESIRVGTVPFHIIGILRPKGFSVVGGDQDDVMIVPMSSARSRLVGGFHQVNRAAVEYVFLKGHDHVSLADIRDSVERILKLRHKIGRDKENDFIVRDPAAALSARREASNTLTVLLACVAAVSLIVGGISVMNIMLVSVVERTREIGIRIAAGARRSDIRRQFLAEAAGVAVIGGLIGAGLGILVAFVVEIVTGWNVEVDLLSVVAAVVFSGMIGIISGVYPAIQASNLNPIQALRRE